MAQNRQKSGGRWFIIEQKIMLQFRNIYSRISTKIRKEAFCARVWGTKMKGKKWTQVMMK